MPLQVRPQDYRHAICFLRDGPGGHEDIYPLGLFQDTEALTGYPFNAGHFVASITYRKSLLALPRQG
jgi:hypothetical protein